MTIRQFCESVAHRNGLTMTAFSAALGYKSANSLYRVMDEKVRFSSLTAFQKKLKETFQLTREEENELKDAVYAKQYGGEKSAFFTVIDNYLQHEDIPVPVKSSPFDAIYERYHGRVDLKITVMNSLDIRVLTALSRLLQEDAYVAHYVHSCISSLDLFRSLSALSVIMFYPRYTCYADQTVNSTSCGLSGLERADLLWCAYTGADGQPHTDLVSLQPDGPVFHEDTGVTAPAFPECYAPVKKQWLEAEQLRDYPTFGRKCELLDRDTSTLKIKTDLTYAEISGDHLAGLLRNGPMSSEPGFDEALKVLTEIYNRRYDNTMHKRKHTWHVMKLSAMRNFMKTGRLTDHMWAMRPFTPEERREVLSELLRHDRANHYMHLFLLRDESMSDHLEFDLYDGNCLLFQNSSTNYDLVNTHGEYLLTHPTLLHWFREYYINVIIKTMCYPENQSVEMLEELLKMEIE